LCEGSSEAGSAPTRRGCLVGICLRREKREQRDVGRAGKDAGATWASLP
jgi:hypothetical protein